jgi:WD40 repeat protein
VGPTDWVRGVAFSPDGQRILSCGGEKDKTLCLWEVESGKLLRRFHGHGRGVCQVAFSPDGYQGLSGSADGSVRLWDVEPGEQLAVLWGHQHVVTAVAFSPDGQRALSGSVDGTMRLWALEVHK